MSQLELPDNPNALFFTCSEHGRQKLDFYLGGNVGEIALKCGCCGNTHSSMAFLLGEKSIPKSESKPRLH